MLVKKRRKNLIKGGDGEEENGENINWNMHKMSLYYATVIIGYFGCKIFMGFYKIYSVKQPDQEIQDFNSVIVLSLLTYIFTGMNARQVLGGKSKSNILFFVGYIVGLNYPAIKYRMDKMKFEGDGNPDMYKGLAIFFYFLPD